MQIYTQAWIQLRPIVSALLIFESSALKNGVGWRKWCTYLENGERGWEIGRQVVVTGGFHLAEQRPVTGRGRRRRRPYPGRERRPQIRTVPLSVSQLPSKIVRYTLLSCVCIFSLTWCSWSRKRFSSMWDRSLASSSADCSAERSSSRSAVWRSSSSHLSLMRSSWQKIKNLALVKKGYMAFNLFSLPSHM